jgi:hypothetical protein
MTDTTDIEKKSLEAHVELCAERYKLLGIKLENVEIGINSTKQMVEDLDQKITSLTEKINDKVMTWGMVIISTLIAACGWLLVQYLQ